MSGTPLSRFELEALRYIRNTGGNATRANFDEDHEPIGPNLWEDLSTRKLVTVDVNGKVQLTPEGKTVLEEIDPPKVES